MMPGPVPKRSDQRRRRNKTDLEQVSAIGTVEVPELGLDDPHPLAVDLYDSLRESAQSRFFEPSDWQRARIACELLSRLLRMGKPSANLYAAVQSDFEALLTAEGDRRRIKLEIDRSVPDDSAEKAKVSRMEAYRRAAQ